jgi:hypothetical protein
MASGSMMLRGATLLLVLVVAAGCVSVPSQSASMKRAGVENMTATSLREQVLQYATDFGQAVERFSDSLVAESDDPYVQYRALLWKSISIRNIREAALISDPLYAMLDVWLYTRQLSNFLGDPPPEYRVYSRESQVAAVGLLEGMEQQIRALAVRLVGEARVAAFEPRLDQFAAEHPIDPLNLNRTSILAADTLVVRSVGGGIGGAIGATYWSMRDVADRASAINDAIGKELRWNLELLAYDLARMPLVDSTLASVRSSLDRLGTLADTLPALVSSERALVLEAVHLELATLTRSINAMRLETVDAVTAERVAVLEALVRERVALLETLHQERIATLAGMDSIVTRAIVQSENLVDHIFWRIVQLVAVVLVLLVVGLGIILRARRPAEP